MNVHKILMILKVGSQKERLNFVERFWERKNMFMEVLRIYFDTFNIFNKDI